MNPIELVALARNPIPSGAFVGLCEGYDGTPLRYARWDATRGPRRGSVAVFTGRSEFIEKYFETVADLRRRGFAVTVLDWRGQGGSSRPLDDPRKGYVTDFSEYDRDLTRFMRDVVLPDCPPPYYALGHSMGGHVLLRQATQPNAWFDRMIVTAPMIALHPERLGRSEQLVRTYTTLARRLGYGRSYIAGGGPNPFASERFENNPLTSDRERYLRNRMLIEAAPHLLLGDPTVAWLDAAFRSMRTLADPRHAHAVRVPVLMFVAGNDRIVSPRACEDYANRLKVGAHVLLPSSRHEILQESDAIRARFWAAFDAYLGIEAQAA